MAQLSFCFHMWHWTTPEEHVAHVALNNTNGGLHLSLPSSRLCIVVILVWSPAVLHIRPISVLLSWPTTETSTETHPPASPWRALATSHVQQINMCGLVQWAPSPCRATLGHAHTSAWLNSFRSFRQVFQICPTHGVCLSPAREEQREIQFFTLVFPCPCPQEGCLGNPLHCPPCGAVGV